MAITCTHLLQALSEEPDYEDSLLQTAINLLNTQHAYAAADSLSAVLASVANTPARQAKKQRTGALEGAVAGAGGSSDGGAGGVGTGAALDTQVSAAVVQFGEGTLVGQGLRKLLLGLVVALMVARAGLQLLQLEQHWTCR